MHFNGETMKYLNTGLVCEQSGLSCVELPKICIPVYREVIKEMAEVIKDSQMRDVFYSLSTGIDILTVSKKTGVAPKKLAYMYKKRAGRSVWNGNLILNGNKSWTVYISDAGIMRHS